MFQIKEGCFLRKKEFFFFFLLLNGRKKMRILIEDLTFKSSVEGTFEDS